MDTGAEVAKRFYTELTDIQVYYHIYVNIFYCHEYEQANPIHAHVQKIRHVHHKHTYMNN